MPGWATVAALAAIAMFYGALGGLAAQSRPERQPQGVEEALRREGEALLRLADAAMSAAGGPSDFTIAWRHDFLKAQPGTFVPFTVTIDRARVAASAGLLYVRAVKRGAAAAPPPARGGEFIRYPVDVVFPVSLSGPPGEPLRITRGVAMAPGDYDLVVVVRERAVDPGREPERGLKAGVLRRSISVPDYWTGELATSTIMLANRIDVLPEPLSGDALQERPYAIGRNEVRIAHETTFRRDQELIVVFLIYNPTVTADRQFEVQVDYQVYRRTAGGERFVTRTEPQRFNPSVLGPRVDPAAEQPVMAGQGILLSSFEAGEYRLGIIVTDLLSRKVLSRDVAFTVAGP